MKYFTLNSRPIATMVLFLLVFSFSFELIPQEKASDQTYARLVEEGNRLANAGEVKDALQKYLKASELAKNTDEKSKIYLKISLSYFRLDKTEKLEESLSRLFEIKPDFAIFEQSFPTEFVKIFNSKKETQRGNDGVAEKVQEQKKNSTENSAIAEKSEPQSAEKHSSKPKARKKSVILPIIIGVVGLTAIAAVLFFALRGYNIVGVWDFEYNADGSMNTLTCSGSRSSGTIVFDNWGEGETYGTYSVNGKRVSIHEEVSSTRYFDYSGQFEDRNSFSGTYQQYRNGALYSSGTFEAWRK
jgi:tetratricopeptide (TPR) repeat protein